MSSVTFVHISDTHITPDTSYMGKYADYTPIKGARALVAQLNALPFRPDFVLHTGDVAADPEPEIYETVEAVFEPLQLPIYYLAGNHDHPARLQEMIGRESITPRLYYTFEVNGVRFACLDSNGPVEPPQGYLEEEQLAWLEALCAHDTLPLVVALHHNIGPGGIPWLDGYMGLVNSDALHRVLLPARDRLRGVFFGHIHQNVEMHRDGILYSSTLSSWSQFHAWPGMDATIPEPGAEPGFSVVTITDHQTFIRRYRFAIP